MIRVAFRWFRLRPVVFLNLLLFIFCLIVGFYLYRDFFGLRDDWTSFNPVLWSSEWEFFWAFYNNNNGRVGTFLTRIPFRLLVRIFDLGPDAFPWWLIYSLSLFCMVTAPINIVVLGKIYAKLRFLECVLILVLLWGVWALNYRIFSATIESATNFPAYPLSVYLMSVGVCLLCKLMVMPEKQWLIGSGAIYLYVSLSIEQALASLPIFFCVLTGVFLIQAREKSRWIKTTGVWIGLTAIAAAVFYFSPGQIWRNQVLGVTLPKFGSFFERITSWYIQSIEIGYNFLFDGSEWFVVLHTVLLVILLILMSGIEISRRQNLGGRVFKFNSLCSVSRLGTVALTFLIAFHASLSTLIVAPYLPARALFYPSFLLIVGICFSLVFFIRILESTKWHSMVALVLKDSYEKNNSIRSSFISAAILILITSLVLKIALGNVDSSVNVYRKTALLSETRFNLLHTILAAHNRSGHENFRIAYHIPGIEAPWGFTGYFSWCGYPNISAILEGEGNFFQTVKNRNLEDLVSIQSDVSPLLPWGVDLKDIISEPVRNLVHVDEKGQGVEIYDFWVPDSLPMCSLIGVHNPNVAGSATYRETFHYLLYFGVSWMGEPKRFIKSHFVGSATWYGTTVTIGFVHNNQFLNAVPLAAFQEPWKQRPFLRVIIANKSASWLAAYSKVFIRKH